MSITLTETALQRVRHFTEKDASALGLRLAVKKMGCSGWAYVVDIANEKRLDDIEFGEQGVRVFVDPQSLPIVDGTEIDFVRRGLNAEFVFANPNVTGACGCGESFSVEREAI